jgi:hypothetical protein
MGPSLVGLYRKGDSFEFSHCHNRYEQRWGIDEE